MYLAYLSFYSKGFFFYFPQAFCHPYFKKRERESVVQLIPKTRVDVHYIEAVMILFLAANSTTTLF